MADKDKEGILTTQVGPQTPVVQALESAPVIYVDGAVGLAVAEGLARFNLYQDRVTISPEQKPDLETAITRTVCARLVMPVSTMQKIHEWLGEGIDKMSKEPAPTEPEKTAAEKDVTD